MNIRKITSLTMLLSFVLCILTSVILYITPYGRVAYWSDWHLWGLSKTQWGDLHLNLGLLMLTAGCLHLYYNWRPLLAYIKNKTRQVNVCSPNLILATLLTLAVGLGTYLQVPPLVTIVDLGIRIKDGASKVYGEPPYGHAELSSLKMFATKMDLDLEKSMGLLEEAGIKVLSEKQTLVEIAQMNSLVPKEVYETIKSAAQITKEKSGISFPEAPPPGFGNKTLNEVFTEFNLNGTAISLYLLEKGIDVDPSSNIKKIAASNEMEPMALFEIIHEAVVQLHSQSK